jgi:ABC-type antimicrobial peptide transport system permease subunit
MKIPLSYSFRNLWTRRLTTGLTILGIALVVFVFAATLMLANGLREAMVSTGEEENVIVIRKAALAESQSAVTREQANIVKTQPEVVALNDGAPMATSDVVVSINVPKRGDGGLTNLVVRGVTGTALEIRKRQVKLIEGRMYQPGLQEVIIGQAVHDRFEGFDIGNAFRMAGTVWTIVGIFDGHGTGFDSEVWGDAEIMMPAIRRPSFSSVTVRLKDANSFEALKARLEHDPRMTVDLKREKQFYDEQSQGTSAFITFIGATVTFIFSFGAMIGAMITMYAAVSNRTQEIGTLRSLGFRRRSVLSAFLFEALLLALIGGVIGIAVSSVLQFFTVSTTNWTTFSELAFGFRLSLGIVISALIFALVMGIVGGFLPAVRASRLKIVEAMRTE